MTVREQGIFMALDKFRKAMPSALANEHIFGLIHLPSDRQRDHVLHVRNTFTSQRRYTLSTPSLPYIFL